MPVISRRSVFSLFPLLILAFLFTVSISAQEAEEGGLKPIPGWAQSEIDLALARFQEWKGNDEVVAVPLVSDVHSEPRPDPTVNGDPEEPDWSDAKNHIYIAQRAAALFGADFMVDLGDIGMNSGKPDSVYWRIAAQMRIYQDFTAVPVFFCIGNHDHGPDHAPMVSNRLFGEIFNLPTLRRGVPAVTGPDFDYGYYDLPEKKTRAFFLNTSDGAYYGYSREQLQFLADHLRLPAGWTVVVFQHFCVGTPLGAWKGYEDDHADRDDVWAAIVRGFLHNEAGETDGVTWDFTKNEDCRFAACITGDSHYDNQGTVGEILYVITQGFGGIHPNDMPDDAIKTAFDKSSQTLIDIAAIKPKTRELRIFRIGAGGAGRDRAFTF